MKLSSKEEAKILKVYKSYWEGYVSGDVAGMSKLLDNKYTQVGSAEAEVFSNKKDAVKFLHDTIDQVAGKAEIRNQSIKLEYLDDYILVNDLFDIYVLTDGEWVYYAKLRASTLMSEDKGKWKFIHQHSSVPDIRTEDGENIATDKIAKENLQLRDAIKRRTVELESKNRELEIESALERVRARAMAMNKSEELGEAAVLLYKELRNLGVNQFFSCGYVLVDEKNKKQYGWLTDGEGDFLDKLNLPLKGDSVLNPRYKSWKRKDPIFSQTVGGEEFKKHQAFVTAGMDSEEMEKVTFQLPDPTIFYCANFSHGYLHILSSVPLSKEEESILVRFTSVFQMTYRRFLDLQKAETQAREAQIELALERVRARTMAMQNSDELADVATVLFQQVKELGIPQWTCGFNIWEMGEKEFTFYPGGPDGEILPSCKVPLLEHPIFRQFDESRTRGDELFVYEKEGEVQADHYRYMRSLPGIGDMLQGMLDQGLEFPSFQIDHVANFSYGNLIFITYEPFPEMHDVFIRFAKVFEQTYTRFLDLQKAEVQARKAQIEAALERVRGRTMAMRKSDEMPEVANNLFLQVKELGLPTWSAGYCIWQDDKKAASCSMSSEGVIQKSFTLPSIGVGYNFYDPVIRGENFFVAELGGKEIIAHYKFMRTLPVVGEILDGINEAGFDLPSYQIFHIVYFKHGYLMFITYEAVPDAHDLFKRFALVFEQTYTRFLDLQKSEEQAREVQIELAVEKVRAKALSMHNSSEIMGVVSILRNEMLGLNIPGVTAATIYLKEKAGFLRMWDLTSVEKREDGFQFGLDVKFQLEKTDPNLFIRKVWKGRKKYAMVKQEALDMAITLAWLKEHNPEYAEQAQQFFKSNPWEYILHPVIKLAYGKMSLDFLDTEPPMEIESIMTKMGSAFDLAYKRFLDLQKAEEQTREALIEVALERVRARTMAMHKSSELGETAFLLFQQMLALGVKQERFVIGILNENKKEIDFWGTAQGGNQLDTQFRGNITEKTCLSKFYAAWKAKKKSLIVELSGADLKAWIKYLKEEINMPLNDELVSAKRVHSLGIFSSGFLLITTPDLIPKEHIELLERFAAVFEQTYTRFLDLQKAEEQAREAQIETSLERVRRSTMAMHKSEDLLASANLLYNEFKSLGFTQYFTCGFVIVDEENSVQHVWVTDMDGEIFESFKLPLTGDPVFQDRYEKWQLKVPVYYQKVGGAKLKKHLAFAIPHFGSEEAEDMVANQFPDPTYFYMANFSHGYLHIVGDTKLTDDEEVLLARFMRVFEQTYSRFLDLQKAEEQAREAQIEAALERVRGRTMAMQKSDEMPEVANNLFLQVQELGLPAWSAGYCIWQDDKKAASCSMSSEGVIQKSFKLPSIGEGYNFYDPAINGESFYVAELGGKEIVAHYKFMRTLPVVGEILDGINEAGFDLPSFQIFHIVYFKHGYLMFITYEAVPDAHDLFKRFALVFEQTYTRFLDLQKAEEQAHEVQIELGLERVRARAMAMQDSSELAALVDTLIKELTKLDFSLTMCIINIIDEKDKSNTVWASNPETGKDPEAYYMKFEDYEFHHGMWKAWKAKKTSWIYTIEGAEKEVYDEYLFNETEFRRFSKKAQKDFRTLDRYVASFTFSNFGGLQTVGDEPLSDENLDILARFGNVFDLTYTRFNDLKHAEAQVREAQIEAALERVRSRSMAMHKSDELEEVIHIVYEQIVQLNINAEHAGFAVDYEPGGNWNYWVADPLITSKVTVPHFDSVWSNQFNKAIKEGDDFFATRLDFKEKNRFYRDLLKHIPSVTKKAKDFYFNCPGLAVSTVIQMDVVLYIENFTGTAYTDEENSILMRFGKVFQQTYTRFLDLQKAEAQAREAQIEAALERVRAITMAMHKSKDLSTAITTVFSQLSELNFTTIRCGIGIFNDRTRRVDAWTASEGEENNTAKLSGDEILEGHPLLEGIFDAWENQQEYSYVLEGDDLKNYYNVTANSNLPVSGPKGNVGNVTQYYQCVMFPAGGLFAFKDKPFTDEEKILMRRFADVFHLTFIRHLDLMQAEAQAREAQIEAALERIRAKALTMHASKELMDVAQVLREQMGALGQSELIGSVIHLYPDNSDFFKSSYSFSPDQKRRKVVTGSTLFRKDTTSLTRKWLKFYHSDDNEYTIKISGAELKDWIKVRNKEVPFFAKNKTGKQPATTFYHGSDFSGGSLIMSSHEEPSQEAKDLQRRAASVFDLAYRRFLDLQKAEEQAREAQIEAALERVRSKSMAMHKSEDMGETVATLFAELLKVGIHKSSRSGIGILNETKNMKLWSALSNSADEVDLLIGILDMTINPLLKKIKNAWKKQDEQFYYELEGKELSDYYASINQEEKYALRTDLNKLPEKEFIHVFTHKHGIIYSFNSVPISAEAKQVFIRFAKVFEQTYTRFLDLQRAEEQSRKAQIETALERVRAKSMAMHKTSELKQVIDVISQQFDILGITHDACMVNIFGDETNKDWNFWIATYPDQIHVPYFKNSIITKLASARKNNIGFYTEAVNRKDKDGFFEYFYAKAQGVKIPQKRKNFIKKARGWTGSVTLSKYASIHLVNCNDVSYTKEENEILIRIGNAFEQAYIRFLDLQKAEEQAREAQIEASLERVRAKAMAMHSTEDITETVGQLFQELDLLDVSLLRCGVGRIHKGTREVNLYTFSGTQKGTPVPVVGNAILAGHPVLNGSYQGWVKQEEYHAVLKGASLKKYLQLIKPGFKLPKRKQDKQVQHGYFFYFSAGCLYTFTETEFTEEELSIFRKFSSVVGLTYRRFLDLAEAEAQVREAQVEASLERVRAKAMSMHSSEDLVDTASQLFKEFQHLEIPFIRCGVLKISEDRKAEVFSYSRTKENEAVAVFGNLNLTGHELIDGVFKHWHLQKEYVHEMKGDAVKRYYQLVNKQLKIPKVQLKKSHFGYAFYFPEGCLYCFTNEKLGVETLQILRRFNSVMGLTYRRYFELMEAEERELAAIKESSLDRVRAEIASMRTAADLNRITPLVWKELTTLGVPFFRCGVFIIDDKTQLVHAYLTTPTGESITALELEFDSMPLIVGAVKYWQQQEVYIEKWNKQQFIQFTAPLVAQGQIKSAKKYQGGLDAPEQLVLQMVPFTQGMMYVGSEKELSNLHIELVKSLAEAFAVAYARYDDFKELEAAKKVVEGTLTELKSTQDQLVQSEKMASLGELTAGIAHEIQNPLNFVNNFSEVSGELVEEMKDERSKLKTERDEALEEEILDDLKQNLEKINHHGQRASGIVKGMLEHSRSGSGEKTLVDINKLADEYLRLSYHGLRAKDKSFNADFKTDFDESLPKVKVITQDLGRVILNLINNAFYACTERRRSTDSKDYKPTVTVTTRKIGDKIEISVKDNGAGIPDDIKEKIFQPFFTTKPTGSGTGLGLSMSYDIITKGHGGELKVESKIDEGSQFIINLPIV